MFRKTSFIAWRKFPIISHVLQLTRWISKPTLDRHQIFWNNMVGGIENLESYFSWSLENLRSRRWSILNLCIISNHGGAPCRTQEKYEVINLPKKESAENILLFQQKNWNNPRSLLGQWPSAEEKKFCSVCERSGCGGGSLSLLVG